MSSCLIGARPRHRSTSVCLHSGAAAGGNASGNPTPPGTQSAASAGGGFVARLSQMLQRGGGFQRVLFVNHVLLIVL
jgi:hypothetical protein